MLKISVQKLGDASVLRCHGRIVAGDAGSILRSAVLNQRHTRTVVIDLAGVDRIDAGGLGVLLSLRESALSRRIIFKLMNARKLVEDILERTHLRPVFEFCSVPELFCLLHRADSLTYCSADQSSRRTKMTGATIPWNGQERFRPFTERRFRARPTLNRWKRTAAAQTIRMLRRRNLKRTLPE